MQPKCEHCGGPLGETPKGDRACMKPGCFYYDPTATDALTAWIRAHPYD